MADATYTDFLIQEAENRQRAKLRGAYFRTGLGNALLLLCGFIYVNSGASVSDGEAISMLSVGVAAFATLAGHTPKLIRQITVIANAPIHASPSYQDQTKAIQTGRKNGTIQSPALRALDRRLHALFLMRMLGGVLFLMAVVVWSMKG